MEGRRALALRHRASRRRSIGVVVAAVALLAAVGAADFVAGANEPEYGVEITGEVSALVVMTEDGHTHQHSVHLATEDGTVVELAPSPVTDELATSYAGATVEVHGHLLAAAGATDAGQDVVVVEEFTPLASAAPPALVSRRAAAIRFKFATSADYHVGEEQLRNAVFTGPVSLNAFWQGESRGKLGMTGDVFSEVLPANFSPTSCSYWSWASELKKRHPGYGHYLIFAPYVQSCGWAGLGQMPGTTTWYNGSSSARVIWHELGHNLGFHHSRSLRCTDAAGKTVTISNTCTASEYGDPFEVMGGGTCSHSTYNKMIANWGVDMVTVDTNKTVELRAAELAPNGKPQVLRIHRPNDAFFGFYYIEWQSTRWSTCTANSTMGLQIRTAGIPSAGRHANIVDATPETGGNFTDGTLKVGKTFTDPVNNISVTLDTMDAAAGVASVRVTFGAPPPTTRTTVAPPTTTSSTSTTVPPPPAPAVVVVNGQLRVSDRTGSANDFRITDTAGGIEVTDTKPLTAGAGCATVTATKVTCNTAITNVVVDAGNGDDHVTTATARKTVARGGPGNDTLHAAAIADGPTRFDGGDGTDTADYSARTDNLKVSLEGAANDGNPRERDNIARDVENLTGGTGNDRLIGNALANIISGGTGDDFLRGGNGTDTHLGGSGNDQIRAKDRTRETIDCNTGTDRVWIDRTLDTTIGCEMVT